MIRFKSPRKLRRLILPGAIFTLALALCGCETARFYSQAIRGQCEIFTRKVSCEKLIASPNTPPELKERLQLAAAMRAFAETELHLPVDGHYEDYADLKRPFVVWSVTAGPEFSLEQKTWWYPLVGAQDYRGYFTEKGANRYAKKLRARGLDVYVGGVEAYSTLGWFNDPLLNTFLHHDEAALAEILFHELAHQEVFASGDTDFNEAFATAVGQEGARRWLRYRNDPSAEERYRISLQRNRQFVQLIDRARHKLELLYNDERDSEGKIVATSKPRGLPPDRLREEKQRILDDLRAEYEVLKANWNGYTGYDAWFARDLNNAQLNTVATYHDLLPGFERLLEANGGDLKKFYAAVKELENKSKAERRQFLESVAP